jgi:hypothetical protein
MIFLVNSSAENNDSIFFHLLYPNGKILALYFETKPKQRQNLKTIEN